MDTLTFIDIFCGIGGFRIALEQEGLKCAFSCDYDPSVRKTYKYFYGEEPAGDITSSETKASIPDKFDILCAGFPCQPFSITGKRMGFEDTRGTLFFDLADIIRTKKPRAFILENVKNLQTHDNGRTFDIIKQTLTDIGYGLFYKVMNATEYANIPQNRERIFIVGFDPVALPYYWTFTFPDEIPLTKTTKDCIDYTVSDEKFFYRDDRVYFKTIDAGITDPDVLYQFRRSYVRGNRSGVCPTLTANMGTGGNNVPMIRTPQGIRKLTPRECLNFLGFPPQYQFPDDVKLSAQYKQAGNSVVVPLVNSLAKEVVRTLNYTPS